MAREKGRSKEEKRGEEQRVRRLVRGEKKEKGGEGEEGDGEARGKPKNEILERPP